MLVKILFVCHGNICRSPMAEFVMKALVQKRGLTSAFEIASAATSTEEIGNNIYGPAQRCLRAHGVPYTSRAARQITKRDVQYWDYIIGMDDANMRNMRRMFGSAAEGKLYKLLDFTSDGGNVADPWYSGDFETAFADISAGCEALLEQLVHERHL